MPCRRTLQSGSRSSLAEALTATIAEATIGGMVTPPASNTQPLTDADLAALTALLDSLPQTLEPLDIVMPTTTATSGVTRPTVLPTRCRTRRWPTRSFGAISNAI